MIDDVIDGILSKSGVLVNAEADDVERLPTGLPDFDEVLGGGLPKGRISVFWGAKSTGKTTVAMEIASTVSKSGKGVLWVDGEHTFDMGYARSLGIHVENLKVIAPRPDQSAEEILSLVTTLINVGVDGRVLEQGEVAESYFGLIVIDSTNSLPTMRDQSGDYADADMGRGAKMWGKFGRFMPAFLHTREASLILINQMRTNIGGYGNPRTMSGGHAMQHMPTVVLEFLASKRDAVSKVTKEMAEAIGMPSLAGRKNVVLSATLQARIYKTKMLGTIEGSVAEATLRLLPYPVIDPIPSLLRVAISHGIVTNKDGGIPSGNSAMLFEGKQIGVGKSKTIEAIRADSELTERLYQELYSHLHGGNNEEATA